MEGLIISSGGSILALGVKSCTMCLKKHARKLFTNNCLTSARVLARQTKMCAESTKGGLEGMAFPGMWALNVKKKHRAM